MSIWALGALSALILIMGITILPASPPQESPYWRWLQEDVPYISTDQERFAFNKLTTDDEREMFIESFWERRNPNPLSPENEYKEEYYQRIIYANEHFGSGIPGWKTDRGRIYIMFGPPDEVDSHPNGESYERPEAEGGGRTIFGPFEQWRYRYIDGIGSNVVLRFADTNMEGEYRLTIDPGEKDALSHAPPYGMTYDNPMRNNVSPDGSTFTRLDLYIRAFRPPPVKFKDLKAVVTSRMSFHLLPFEVRTDFIRATDETVLTPITVQIANSDLQFQNKDGVMHGVLDIFGEVTSLSGRIVNTFEKTLVLDVPEHEFQPYQKYRTVYQEAALLRPGRYKLSLVLKDDLSDHMETKELGIAVPGFSKDELTYSSLILADQIQPLPNSQVGHGPFRMDGTKVRPSVNNTFTRD
jgi:GWxTD domain-containing protein